MCFKGYNPYCSWVIACLSVDLSPLTLLYSQQNAHPLEDDVGISGPSFDQVAVVVEVAECELHPFVPHHSVADLGFCKKNSQDEELFGFLQQKTFTFMHFTRRKPLKISCCCQNQIFLVYSISQALPHCLANDIETGSSEGFCTKSQDCLC